MPVIPVDMYREVRGQLHAGAAGAVIEDRGHLHRALPAGSGDFLFSEAGAGVRALVLIGLWNETLNWLAKHGGKALDNTIKTLPDIYMGITYYRPGERFKGLFPVHAVVNQVAGAITGMVPGTTLTDVAGAVGDIREAGKRMHIFGGKSSKQAALSTTPVYIKFHYLQGTGMTRIGSGRVSFTDIHSIALRALSAMSPIKRA